MMKALSPCVPRLVAALSLIALGQFAFAEIGFFGPDINPNGEILFSLKADVPGDGSYPTLFLKRVGDANLSQLTFYPESIESLADGTVLQLRNRFGTGRIDAKTQAFSWVRELKPFVEGGTPLAGRLGDVSTSPNGRWVVSIEPTGPAAGRLVILDLDRSLRYEIAPSVSLGSVPVAWSPDSSVLIYEYGSSLHFARPEYFFSANSVSEEYRELGPGRISSVYWYAANRFLYVRDTDVFRIQSSELLSRSLYGPLIGVGELAGKLPFPFNPETDRFCGSRDGNAIVYTRDKRGVYYTGLSGDDYAQLGRPARYPYLLLPGNTAEIQPIWTAGGVPAVFTQCVEDGSRKMKAWRLVESGGSASFTALDIPQDTESVVASPSGSWVALKTANSVSVRDSATWAEKALFREESVVSCAWADEGNLFIGGAETVRKWNLSSLSSVKYLYSAVNDASWDQSARTVIASTPLGGKVSWTSEMKWAPAPDAKARPASGANASWRLYLDSSAGFFSNMLYIRSATGPGGTKPLIREPSTRFDPLGAALDPIPEGPVVSHGSRSGAREAALVFDAIDTLEGLPEILSVLDRYGIRATFFINGEFIRRHPSAVNEIVKAGHQAASMFFTAWDLTNAKYRIDEDFLVRGLSRNEDDFYNATGQELSLLWHAPWYVSSPLIVSSAEKAGYKTVAPDVTVLDWVTKEQGQKMPGLYHDTAWIIENVMAQKKPGSIIPVRVGHPEGTRSDWLCDKVDLLINALVESGYRLVTVDTLLAHAR